MENKDLNNFTSGENEVFEDIISDSSMSGVSFEEVYSSSSFAKKGKYAKKQRGIKGAIIKWWKKRKAWQKASMITALCVILVFSVLAGIFFSVFDYNYNKITKKPEDLGFENIIDKNIVNVALFGIDTREVGSFKGLSDSIMVLSLNTVTKKVKIISIMRDTLVPIKYNGKTQYAKINSAYQMGGPELAIKTINLAFGLDISEYATVNFFGMVDIIDAIGGIEAELTKDEVSFKPRRFNECINEICIHSGRNAEKYYITTAGKHTLNGVQAVAYSRIRYAVNVWGTNNDHGRTDRQRYVMEQLFNKALTLDKSQYVALVKALIPCAETSLSYSEILGLAFDILLKSPTFEQTRIPLNDPKHSYEMRSPSNSPAGSVVYFDLDFATELIHAFIYDDIPQETYIEENGVKKNDWYGKLFPSSSGSSGSGSGSGSGSSEKEEPSTEQTPDDPSNKEPEDEQGGEENPIEKPESGEGNETDEPQIPENDEEKGEEEGGSGEP